MERPRLHLLLEGAEQGLSAWGPRRQCWRPQSGAWAPFFLRVRETSHSQVSSSDSIYHEMVTLWDPQLWHITLGRSIHFQNRLSAGNMGRLSLFLVLLWQKPQRGSKLIFVPLESCWHVLIKDPPFPWWRTALRKGCRCKCCHVPHTFPEASALVRKNGEAAFPSEIFWQRWKVNIKGSKMYEPQCSVFRQTNHSLAIALVSDLKACSKMDRKRDKIKGNYAKAWKFLL